MERALKGSLRILRRRPFFGRSRKPQEIRGKLGQPCRGQRPGRVALVRVQIPLVVLGEEEEVNTMERDLREIRAVASTVVLICTALIVLAAMYRRFS